MAPPGKRCGYQEQHDSNESGRDECSLGGAKQEDGLRAQGHDIDGDHRADQPEPKRAPCQDPHGRSAAEQREVTSYDRRNLGCDDDEGRDRRGGRLPRPNGVVRA